MRRVSRTIPIAAMALAGWIGCSAEPDAALAPSGPSMSTSVGRTLDGRDDNSVPTILSVDLMPSDPAVGDAVSASVSSEDADGDTLTHRYEWSLRGVRLKETGNQIVLSDARKGDFLELEVTASDGVALSEPYTHRVHLGNNAPRIESLSFRPGGRLRAGRELRVVVEADDRDGDALEFSCEWFVNDELRDDSGDAFSTEGLRRGDWLEVRVVATDGDAYSTEFSSTRIELVNAPPAIAKQPIASSAEEGFVYRIPASDPDGDMLRFALEQGPEGMELNRTRGDIAWHPTADQSGDHEIVVLIDDLHGGVTRHAFSLSVDVGSDEAAPAAPAAE